MCAECYDLYSNCPMCGTQICEKCGESADELTPINDVFMCENCAEIYEEQLQLLIEEIY
jgi:hypothetical protein